MKLLILLTFHLIATLVVAMPQKQKKILFYGMQTGSHIAVNLNIVLHIAKLTDYKVSMIDPGA